MKKAKRYGKPCSSYDKNPDRRMKCPEWTFYPSFIKELDTNAKIHDISRSQYFERVVQNFFLIESPFIQIAIKHNYSLVEKTIRLRRLYIHPTVLELIAENSKKSNVSQSKYLTMLFALYKSKFENEIDIVKILFV